MSSGAWVRTAADAVTAGAAVAGAAVGGVWAFFRYRREAPDLPRANAAVSATLFDHAGSDYISVDVDLRHTAGGPLTIVHDNDYDPPEPVLEVSRLGAAAAGASELAPTPICSVPVFRGDTELDAGEYATDHRVIALGPRLPDTIAYDVTVRFVAGWKKRTWTWSPNTIVQVAGPGPATSTGTSPLAAPSN